MRTLRVLALGRISPVAIKDREEMLATASPALRKGYGLVEIILGIALIAAFVVRIFQSYTQADNSNRAQDFMSMVGLINATIRSQSINAPDFAGVSVLTIAPTIPRKYISGTAAAPTIRSVYQQDVAIAPADITGTQDGFTITTQIPQGECIKVALADMGRGINSILVNATTFTDARVTQDQASAACGSGTPSTMVPIAWTMQ